MSSEVFSPLKLVGSFGFLNAENDMKIKTLFHAFIALLMSSSALADTGDKEYSRSTHNKVKFQIPSSCVVKAQAMAASTAMSGSDRSASLSFVSVLSAVGSTLVVDYSLVPKLIQKGGGQGESKRSDRLGALNRNPGTTEISLTGSLATLQITLADVNGAAFASSPVYASTSDAQAPSAGVALSASLVQKTGNQTTISLDLIGTDIKSFYTNLSFHSDLLNQASIGGQAIAGLTTDPTSGLPFYQAHALNLADLVTSIDIRAVVRFDGTQLSVDIPSTVVGC